MMVAFETYCFLFSIRRSVADSGPGDIVETVREWSQDDSVCQVGVTRHRQGSLT